MRVNATIVRLAQMYELDHDFALAVIGTNGDGFLKVVARADGTILTWDGTYLGNESIPGSTPVLEHDFDNWDDSRWKLIVRANAQHLGPDGAMHDFLAPTYSPAAAAVSLLESWADSTDFDPDVLSSRVLAYVPITEGASITAWLAGRS